MHNRLTRCACRSLRTCGRNAEGGTYGIELEVAVLVGHLVDGVANPTLLPHLALRAGEHVDLAHLEQRYRKIVEEGLLIHGIQLHERNGAGVGVQVLVGHQYAPTCRQALEVAIVEDGGRVGVECHLPVDARRGPLQAVRVNLLPVLRVGKRIVARDRKPVLNELRAPSLTERVPTCEKN